MNVRVRSAEAQRLIEEDGRDKNWKRWGTYLAERQWGTVREDYSPDGDAWRYFPHDLARRRAYRWGEDGLLGWCDRQCRLAFALALWNRKDPFIKERLYGLAGPEGNHGEDVKECYYYLDATPTHSYVKGLYKYPQAAFPYSMLIEENARRGRDLGEFELTDTGIFDGGVTSMCSSSMRNTIPTALPFASQSPTAVRKQPHSTSCQRYGSATRGHGDASTRDARSSPGFGKRGRGVWRVPTRRSKNTNG